MSDDKFESLLGRMGEIASAVNAFASESVQREAFAALVEAFGGGVRSPQSPPATVEEIAVPAQSKPSVAEVQGRSDIGRKKGNKKKREGAAQNKNGFTLLKDLDLRPTGKTPFSQFIDEKKPKSNEDKYTVIVY